MPASKPFLTARWTNLALITYAVDPSLLAPHVPPDCELDTIDGCAFVSLVAFDFLDAKVFGIRWPTLTNFPEINLRFYVRHNGSRGVCFIRELVPSRLIATVARWFYNEPYFYAPMKSEVARGQSRINVKHVARVKGKEQSISISAKDNLFTPAESSREHFFKEHSWGFGKNRRGDLIRYEVNHPVWQIYREPVIEKLEWDFAQVYGEKWKFLNSAQPTSIILAAGSQVRVFPK